MRSLKKKMKVKEIECLSFQKKREDNRAITLIDVREDEEWESGRIPGALHIPKGLIENEISKVTRDKKDEIVLYCRGGYRSADAALMLLETGYTNVYSLRGGIVEWGSLNLPIES